MEKDLVNMQIKTEPIKKSSEKQPPHIRRNVLPSNKWGRAILYACICMEGTTFEKINLIYLSQPVSQNAGWNFYIWLKIDRIAVVCTQEQLGHLCRCDSTRIGAGARIRNRFRCNDVQFIKELLLVYTEFLQ